MGLEESKSGRENQGNEADDSHAYQDPKQDPTILSHA